MELETDNCKLATSSARRLILMRHAKSSWGNPGVADHDRPLNQRGSDSALALGDWLRDNKLLPDEALVSSARRTQETFAGLRLEVDSTVKRELYHSSSDQLLESLSEATGQCVMLVAHNPGIGDLALRLARLMRQHPEHSRFADFPTGATFVVEWDSESWAETDWSTGEIKSFVTPKDLI